MRRLAFVKWLVVAALLAGCAPGVAEPATELPTAAVQVVTAVIYPTATPECTPLVEGMVLQVTGVNSATALIDLAGFVPGDELHITFLTTLDSYGASSEAFGPMTTVDAEGRLHYEATNLSVNNTLRSPFWDVRIAHQNGVACSAVDLPME